MIGHPRRSGAKRTQLERIARGEQGAKLRSQVAAWHPGTTRDELDEAFQEACARAERGCRGESEGEVFTWLRTTTHREVVRMHERVRHEGLVAVPDRALDDPGESALPEDQLIEREDREEIEAVTRSVIARLSDHQRDIAALHSDGMGRPQIAARLGLSDRSVKRGLERIMAVGRDELVRLAGHGCQPGEDLVARFAFGLADPIETRRAQLHLAGCQRCGELHKRLDLWRENVAAVLPVPPAAQQHGTIEHWLNATAEAVTGVKRHVVDAIGQVKQQLSATYVRAADPTPLAGIRPGAAAAAIAGCLAIGGGATYCAQQGLDPLAGLAGLGSSGQHDNPRTRPKTVRAVAAPVVAAARPTVKSPVAASKPAKAPPPAPQDEFEPGTAGSPIAATTSSKSSAKPAPVSSAGGGEFGGP